jgi:hypothetical protein
MTAFKQVERQQQSGVVSASQRVQPVDGTGQFDTMPTMNPAEHSSGAYGSHWPPTLGIYTLEPWQCTNFF